MRHRRRSRRNYFLARLAIGICLAIALAWAVGTSWTLDAGTVFGQTAFLLTVCAVVCVYWTVRGIEVRFNLTAGMLLVAAGWCFLQLWTGWSRSPFETLRWGMELLGLAAAFWLGLQSFASSRMQRRFLMFFTLFGSLVAVLAVLQYFTAEGRVFWLFSNPYTDKPMGPFLNRNHYGAFMELVLPLTLWGATERGKEQIYYGALSALVYASVILSASRTGAILVTVELIVILVAAFVRQGGRARVVRTALQVGVLAVVFSAVVGWQFLFQRFDEKGAYASRRAFLESSVVMFRQHPLTGFGLGAWPAAYPRFATYDANAFVNHAHNDWAEFAVDGGVLFLVLLGGLAARAVWLSFREPWSLGLAIVLLHALGDFPLQKNAILIAFVLLLSCAESRVADGRPHDHETAGEELLVDAHGHAVPDAALGAG